MSVRKNKKLRKRLYFVLFGVSSAIFIFLLVLLFCLYVFHSISTSNETRISSEYNHEDEYLFTELRVGNEGEGIISNFGFVTLPHEKRLLSQDDYITYLNEGGSSSSSSVIITNFGGSKYTCTGSCYCNEEFERRSSSGQTKNILVKGLTILFSAFSATMAYKIANDVLQEQCDHQYSGTCLSENIETEVDKCSTETTEEEKEEKEEDSNKYRISRNYICKGHCVEFAPDNKELKEVGRNLFGDCEKLSLEKEFRLVVQNPKKDEQITDGSLEYTAMWKFGIGAFSEFCTERTRVPFPALPSEDRKKLEDALEVLVKLRDDGGTQKRDEKELELIGNLIDGTQGFVDKGKPFCVGFENDQNQQIMLGKPPKRENMKNIKCIEVRREEK